MRRLLTLAVVGSWLVLLGLLVERQAPPPRIPAAPLPAAAGAPGDREEWFTVQRDGQRVGWAHRVTGPSESGVRMTEDMVVALAMLGTPQRLRTSLVAETDATRQGLRRFRFSLVSPAATFSASGESDGQRLQVHYGPAGDDHALTLPLSEPIALPSTLRPRVLSGDRTPGTRYTAPVFNPFTLKNEPLTIVVEGRERVAGPDGPVDALVIAEEHQGLRARAWIADDGSTVREEGTLGFTLARTTSAEALSVDSALAAVDLAVSARIPLEGHIAHPRTAQHLRLRVSGEAATSVPDDPPRQRRSADRLEIAREALPARTPYPAPADPARAPYLAPGPFIESDDAEVVATARAAVAGARDAVTAAQHLVAWVNDHVEQAPSVTVPSTRAVLAARRGDCNEHAVLLTGLARAAGIPARVVAGAMYLDGAFYYHAWTELWLGAWVSADSVFRQLPADATHVKLVEGGPEHHLALAAVIGRLAFATEEGTP
jgi:Transglutaminase-like superfamily